MAGLNATQMTALKSRLKERHAELRREIRDELARVEGQHYGDLAERVHDTGDESVADLLADLEIASIDRHVNEVRATEAALQRMDMGGYGVCEECGAAIGYERLLSNPAATRCITCQTRHEKSFVSPGTPRL